MVACTVSTFISFGISRSGDFREDRIGRGGGCNDRKGGCRKGSGAGQDGGRFISMVMA
jgi:hypothetical protein